MWTLIHKLKKTKDGLYEEKSGPVLFFCWLFYGRHFLFGKIAERCGGRNWSGTENHISYYELSDGRWNIFSVSDAKENWTLVPVNSRGSNCFGYLDYQAFFCVDRCMLWKCSDNVSDRIWNAWNRISVFFVLSTDVLLLASFFPVGTVLDLTL